MIDANLVIRLHLKGVAASSPSRLRERHLSERDLLLPAADEQRRAPEEAGEGGGARVLISPDVMCEPHFGNYP